ncbi:MAG: DUF4861 family protein [Sphingomonas sp.]
MNPRLTGALAALLILPAQAQETPPEAGLALATLNVQEGGTRGEDGVWRGGTFRLVPRFDAPAGHGPRDQLVAFEGPGWESDRVGYRLYLDERNVPDVYGKKLPGAVLPRIGQGKDDYHDMADWGMDILQVDATLGAGGIGVLRAGKVTQLGPARLASSVVSLPDRAIVMVESRGWAGEGGPANMVASYAISPGSRLTHVEAHLAGHVPQMMAGLVRHPGTVAVEGGSGKWRYAASWGDQSLAKDGLGLALFFRRDEAGGPADRDGNIAIAFCDRGVLRYAFAAAWVQEPGAPRTLPEYRAWLDATVKELDGGDQRVLEKDCVYDAGVGTRRQ